MPKRFKIKKKILLPNTRHLVVSEMMALFLVILGVLYLDISYDLQLK